MSVYLHSYMDPARVFSVPTTKTVLWNHQPRSKPIVLCVTRNLKVRIQEKTIGDAARLLEAKDVGIVSCHFVGSAVAGSLNKRITVTLNGMTESHSCSRDLSVPVLICQKTKGFIEWAKEHYFADLKDIYQHCCCGSGVDFIKFLKLRIICSVYGVKCDVQVEFCTVSTEFKTILIHPVPITQTASTMKLNSKESSIAKTGFITMDHSKSLILTSGSYESVSTIPLIGLWVHGVPNVHHPIVTVACLRYITCSFLKNRLCLPPLPFLLVIYTLYGNNPEFYDCLCSKGNTVLEFKLEKGCHSLTLAKVPILETKMVNIDLSTKCSGSASFNDAAKNIPQINFLPEHANIIVSNTDDIPQIPRQPMIQKALNFEVSDMSITSEASCESERETYLGNFGIKKTSTMKILPSSKESESQSSESVKPSHERETFDSNWRSKVRLFDLHENFDSPNTITSVNISELSHDSTISEIPTNTECLPIFEKERSLINISERQTQHNVKYRDLVQDTPIYKPSVSQAENLHGSSLLFSSPEKNGSILSKQEVGTQTLQIPIKQGHDIDGESNTVYLKKKSVPSCKLADLDVDYNFPLSNYLASNNKGNKKIQKKIQDDEMYPDVCFASSNKLTSQGKRRQKLFLPENEFNISEFSSKCSEEGVTFPKFSDFKQAKFNSNNQVTDSKASCSFSATNNGSKEISHVHNYSCIPSKHYFEENAESDESGRTIGSESNYAFVKKNEPSTYKDAKRSELGNLSENIPAYSIYEYLKKQDEKLLEIQKQISQLLIQQTQNANKVEDEPVIQSGKINRESCHEPTVSSDELHHQERKCCQCAYEYGTKFSQYLNEQGENIKKIQCQISFLLMQTTNQISCNSSKIIEDTPVVDPNNTSNFATSVLVDTKKLESENLQNSCNAIQDGCKDTCSEPLSGKIKEITKTCTSSTMTSLTLSNDDNFGHVKHLTAMSDISNMEGNESLKQYSEKSLQINNKQLQENKQKSEQSETLSMEIERLSSISSEHFTCFSSDLSNLSLVSSSVETVASISSNKADSIFIDPQEIPEWVTSDGSSTVTPSCDSSEENELKSQLEHLKSPDSFRENILRNVNELILDSSDDCDSRLSLPSQSTVIECASKSHRHSEVTQVTNVGIMLPKSSPENSLNMSETSSRTTQSASVSDLSWEYEDQHKKTENNRELQQCSEISDSIMKYGLSSPNLSFATEQYLNNYGLIRKKSGSKKKKKDK